LTVPLVVMLLVTICQSASGPTTLVHCNSKPTAVTGQVMLRSELEQVMARQTGAAFSSGGRTEPEMEGRPSRTSARLAESPFQRGCDGSA
jgi:hypothetical protein